MVRWAPRPKETCSLRVIDWNARTKVLTLPAAIAKNGRKRSFAVDDFTADILSRAAKARSPHEPLFVNRKGIAWTADAHENILTKAIKAVGLNGTPYSSRHTACTRICQLANGDIPTIQSIIAHYNTERPHQGLASITIETVAGWQWRARLRQTPARAITFVSPRRVTSTNLRSRSTRPVAWCRDLTVPLCHENAIRRKKANPCKSLLLQGLIMARRSGLEPLTYRSVVCCSIQLSYQRREGRV